MPLRLSAEVRAKIEQRLGGQSADALRLVPATATFYIPGENGQPAFTAEEAAWATAMREAGGPPLLTDGLPTIMRATAWMAHEGRNRNGLRFIRDELPAAAAKIKEPNFLVMDFNHSAVHPHSPHPKAIGVWYKASYAFDPKANQGEGAWGILLQGMSWAWAFPDYANLLLAEQERHGAIRFSMACLAESYEIVREASGDTTEVAHNPTFFTLSALDVPPADPDALGLMTEGDTSEGVEDRQAEQLLSAAQAAATSVLPVDTDLIKQIVQQALQERQERDAAGILTSPKEGDAMADQIQNTPAAEAVAKVAELSAELERVNAANTEAQAKIEQYQQEIEALQGKVAECNDDHEVAVAELTSARDALQTELAEAREALAAAEEKLAVYVAEANSRAAEQLAVERQQLIERRVASLPESYRRAHAARADEVRERIEAKWAAMDDEAFEAYKTEELLVGYQEAPRAGMYLRRSQEEGLIPVGGVEANSRKERIRALLRK